MVLLPAMYSIALTKAGLNAASAFGIWSFAGKLALALAAALALPLLEMNGYTPGGANTPASTVPTVAQLVPMRSAPSTSSGGTQIGSVDPNARSQV